MAGSAVGGGGLGQGEKGRRALSTSRSNADFKWIGLGFISLPRRLTVVLISVSQQTPLGKLVHTFPLQTFLCLQVKRALLFSPSRKFSL